MAEMQRSLVIAKPDAVQRGLVGEIFGRLERRGLKLVACRMLLADRVLAEEHYGEHREKPFFGELVGFITSSPVVAAVFAGPDAVSIIRTTNGATRPAESPPGTIRGDFAIDVNRNLVHASDSVESATREIALWFGPDAVQEWEQTLYPWLVG